MDYGLREEYIMVLSKIIIYLLQDGCRQILSLLRVCSGAATRRCISRLIMCRHVDAANRAAQPLGQPRRRCPACQNGPKMVPKWSTKMVQNGSVPLRTLLLGGYPQYADRRARGLGHSLCLGHLGACIILVTPGLRPQHGPYYVLNR